MATGGGAVPGDGVSEPPTKGEGDGADAGRPSLDLDAGAPSTPNDVGSASDAGDASTPVDGGHCTIDSDGRDAGACFGVYCDVMQATFARLVNDQGACLGTSDLALACDGELARVVARCAQDDVLQLGFGRTVALCAGRAAGLSSASEGCIDCYVDEVLCALQRCLSPCLSASSAECTSCRRQHCGADFSACAGLPE